MSKKNPERRAQAAPRHNRNKDKDKDKDKDPLFLLLRNFLPWNV